MSEGEFGHLRIQIYRLRPHSAEAGSGVSAKHASLRGVESGAKLLTDKQTNVVNILGEHKKYLTDCAFCERI